MAFLRAKFLTLAIASALLGLATARASACAVGHPVNIFFDRAPEESDGFVVLEATLLESHSLIDNAKEWMLVGRARIDKIIKGEINGKTVKLFRYVDPCGMYASGKTRGIVVGTIRNGTQDELEALTEYQWDLRIQALREQRGWRGPEWPPWLPLSGPEWVPPELSGPSTPWRRSYTDVNGPK